MEGGGQTTLGLLCYFHSQVDMRGGQVQHRQFLPRNFCLREKIMPIKRAQVLYEMRLDIMKANEETKKHFEPDKFSQREKVGNGVLNN